MAGEFTKRGGGVHKNNSPRGGSVARGGNRGRLSTRGNRHGGMSPKGSGSRNDLSNRIRGSGKGGVRGGKGNWGDRGGRGSWGDSGRGGRGRNGQGRRGFSAKSRGGIDFKKRMSFDIDSRFERKSVDGKKNENKYQKSISEPSTPADVKFKKYEMDSEHDENEEMSISDMEDEETTTGTPKKIAADVTSKQRKTIASKNGSNFAQIISAKAPPKKKDALKREKDKEDKVLELVTDQKIKKARMVNVESEEDDEEEIDDDEDEDEDESSEEGAEGKSAKNVNGIAEMSESNEDEDEESLEYEDEEEAPSEVKPAHASTPGNTVHLKSALKTPGTGKSSKKVSLSATTTTTPEMLLKNKTPVTPHPQIMSNKNKMRRLRFEESDESDEDEENNDEEDDERLKVNDGKMKMAGNDSEDEDEDDDEEITDDDEKESDEDKRPDNTKRMIIDSKDLAKAKREGIAETIRSKKDRVNLKELHNKSDKGTEEKLASQKQTNAISNKEETKGVKRKWEGGPVLKLEDAKDVVREEQKRREERDKKSLFVRGLPKDVKLGQLKALHNDILYVRHMPHRNFAWLIFASEKLCEKAYEDISKQTVEGRTLAVDFCGAKAKTRPQKDRSQLPINPLELFVGGLPPSTSKDQMKVIFRQATNISFPKQARNKNKLYCFVQFANEKEARAAFEKGKTLKINSMPVDVLYARIRKGISDEAKLPKANQDPSLSNGIAAKSETKSLPKANEVNGDTASEGIESSEEGIQEVDDSISKPKKAKLAKAENHKMLHKLESFKQKKTEAKCTTLSKKPKLKATGGKILSGQSNLESDNLDAGKDEKDNNINDHDDDEDDDDNDNDDDDDDDDDDEEEEEEDEDEDEEGDEDEDEEDGNMEDSDGSN
ncbi:unnamed protein product [Cercopithifilaria johnstoni]|uniref:RRM domain-containing protein n=1 Tax=Cercopithifilaria johnstoni TaxID=2874296 RepID=A0A8J2Q466_9BILA|nr:unnamed protein product [Cercopithifilaria johnstoni]